MFKNILSLFLLVVIIAIATQSFAATEPSVPVDSKIESDSTNVKNKHLVTVNAENQAKISTMDQESTVTFWNSNEEEEDSTTNSALSFNFIYYIIEKFKFQVE